MTTTALIEEEFQLRTPDGTALFVRRVRPPQGQRRARLAVVHGVAEHSGRYVDTLRWFAERGYDCSAVDLRGHGRSGGRRVFVRRWGEYSDDLAAFLREVSPSGGDAGSDECGPLFLLGHSMGGLVVARALQTLGSQLPALRGALILSPFFGIKVAVPGWKVGAGRFLSKIAPWAALPSDLDIAFLSKDPEVGRAYAEDPLVTTKVTARWYTEAMNQLEPLFADAKQLELPMLFFHGEDDQITDPTATQRFCDLAGGSDKTLVTWPGGRHELLNEVEKEQVRERLLAWLEERAS